MANNNFIPLLTICTHYDVDMDLMYDLRENDLLEIIYHESTPCVKVQNLGQLEKMLRLYHDLKLNVAGLDVVFNLLKQIDDLNHELQYLKRKLNIYEQ
ncbi:MAG TPA: chaperone modulator CbpM [Pelobium sp.]